MTVDKSTSWGLFPNLKVILGIHQENIHKALSTVPCPQQTPIDYQFTAVFIARVLSISASSLPTRAPGKNYLLYSFERKTLCVHLGDPGTPN